MPRLLVDGTALSSKPKGVGRYSAHVIEQLCRRLPHGWTIRVVAYDHVALDYGGHIAPEFVYLPPTPELIKGLCILPLLAALYRSDVVLVPFDAPGYLGRKPLLTIVHGIPELITAAGSQSESWQRRMINRLREWCRGSMLRRSAVVVCNSEFVAGEVSKRDHVRPESIRIGYCGVDPRFYQVDDKSVAQVFPNIHRWHGYVLVLTTGDAHERYELCPSILERLHAAVPGVGLVIAGVQTDAAYVANLRYDFAQRGLREGEHFMMIPFIADDELSKLRLLYRCADFYLELSAHEGFGMQLAEAMATGTTCISSGRGALHEVAAGFAIELRQLNTDCAASTLIKCYRDALHRRDNHEQVAYTSRFNWDAVGNVISNEVVRIFEMSKAPA